MRAGFITHFDNHVDQISSRFIMDQKAEHTVDSHIEDSGHNELQGLTTVQVQDSRFATYIAHDRPSPVSKSLLKLYPILFVAFMNSAANGFDGNTFGTLSP
jgi:hypothetical protein